MGAPKKTAARVSDDPEELASVPLKAILLADSFTTKFRPITLERPKVLLPLVNVPMIEYTLTWLESAGVEEVFVFCCAHAKQVINYLESSQWLSQSNFSVSTIESNNCISAGDALRVIYERNVIQGDFVLVSGDTLSNMSLTRALQEHKERRKKDSNAVMTMVIKRSKPSPVTRQSRFGTDELFVAINPTTKQLLSYEENTDRSNGPISLDKMLLVDNSSVSLHNDMQDCYIDICSTEVLSLFTDNFDYQHLRRHFVKGLLVDDIMGYKIFTHEIHSSYAARIDNYRGYDTVSKDIIQRWTYPLVPDILSIGNSVTKLERQGVYRGSDIELARSAHIGQSTVIGHRTKIGSNSRISNSVIGNGCSIGSNVLIEGSYLWDNVTIEDGCEIKHSIICDGVVMKSGAVLNPGVILSFKVVIGTDFNVPAYSMVSLHQQPIKQDSDEELEYADNTSEIETSPIADALNGELTSEFSEPPSLEPSELGCGTVGYIWSACEGSNEEVWRYSVAPIPAEKLSQMLQAPDDDSEFPNPDGKAPLFPGKPGADDTEDTEDDPDDYPRDESAVFEKEVEDTILRAVLEDIEVTHVILEVKSLRLSYNMESTDCAGAVFNSIMKLGLQSLHNSPGELYKNIAVAVEKWKSLLSSYLKGKDEQFEVILRFEEICLESAKKLSPLFTQILHLLYDKDLISEDAVLQWEFEKKDAEESDKVFVKQAENFLQWLREASEEED